LRAEFDDVSEAGDDGFRRKRDPRTLTVEQFNAVGHVKQPLLRVIRANCIECCSGNEADVRWCGLVWYPFWPYRMGANPFAAPRSEARLAHARNRAAALRKPSSLEPEIGEGPLQAME
jgi:hypothetical protein